MVIQQTIGSLAQAIATVSVGQLGNAGVQTASGGNCQSGIHTTKCKNAPVRIIIKIRTHGTLQGESK